MDEVLWPVGTVVRWRGSRPDAPTFFVGAQGYRDEEGDFHSYGRNAYVRSVFNRTDFDAA